MSSISLLWPSGKAPQQARPLDEAAARDLSLEQTVGAFASDRQSRLDLHAIFHQLSSDLDVIHYRQAVLRDFLAFPAIPATFEAIMPSLTALTVYRHSVDRRRVPIQQLAWRASELEYLVECLTAIHRCLAPLSDQLRSAGLQQLLAEVQAIQEEPIYQQLVEELPEISAKLRANVSITIGVNLDRQLRPIEAVLISVNEEKFQEAPFLDRLLGRQGEQHGLAPLHRAPQDLYGVPQDSEIFKKGFDPLMAPLFKDLADVLSKVIKPVEKALGQYVSLNGGFLGELRADLNFYLRAVDLHEKLSAQGLPLCQPEILPQESRLCVVRQSFNLNLARHLISEKPGLNIRDDIVLNDIVMDENGRIQILTGPNQGGKTTYTQMVGLNQILAQAGLFVPGTEARISLVDAILTHYPMEEQLEKSTGRFGDEAKRLADLFDGATRYSLLLFNESLSSTSPGESIYLAQDIVRILRQMGTRAVFNTHLHELAQTIDTLNEDTSGDSRIVSLVASRIEPGGSTGEDRAGLSRRSYVIKPGPPLGRSYAEEIAARYGISYEQLQVRLKERGVLPAENPSNSQEKTP